MGWSDNSFDRDPTVPEVPEAWTAAASAFFPSVAAQRSQQAGIPNAIASRRFIQWLLEKGAGCRFREWGPGGGRFSFRPK